MGSSVFVSMMTTLTPLKMSVAWTICPHWRVTPKMLRVWKKLIKYSFIFFREIVVRDCRHHRLLRRVKISNAISFVIILFIHSIFTLPLYSTLLCNVNPVKYILSVSENKEYLFLTQKKKKKKKVLFFNQKKKKKKKKKS